MDVAVDLLQDRRLRARRIRPLGGTPRGVDRNLARGALGGTQDRNPLRPEAMRVLNACAIPRMRFDRRAAQEQDAVDLVETPTRLRVTARPTSSSRGS